MTHVRNTTAIKAFRWQPGQSGNPSGRKPTPEAIKEAFAAMTPRAVEVLGELLEGDDDRLRLLAAQTVLDRHLGKPLVQAAVAVANADAGQAHLEALKAIQARREARLAAAETITPG